MKTNAILGLLAATALLGACADTRHHQMMMDRGATVHAFRGPTASPGCERNNKCRVYLSVEKDSTGQEKIWVYPYDLETHSRAGPVRIVWILLNSNAEFDPTACDQTPDRCPIRFKNPDDQFSDPYTTDDDDGNQPSGSFRSKNFHWKLRQAAKIQTYTYEVAVIKNGVKISRDPTITNRD